ncbi:MAG: transglutaminase domain-containing protein [Clostridia bacterium]|nr:transglutaminase domain-containing protein [Clostridia bacterium]
MKFLKVFLCVTLALCLASCTFPYKYSVNEEHNESMPEVTDIENIVPQHTDIDDIDSSLDFETLRWRNVKRSDYYKEVSVKYGYNSLNDVNLRNLYEKIESAMYTVSEKVDKKGRYTLPQLRVKGCFLSNNEIQLVLQAIYLDYPQVFWFSNYFSYVHDNGSTLVQLYAVEDKDSIQDKINTFSATVSSIISSIPGGLSEYEREKVINDYLVDNCVYDEDAIDTKTDWQPFCLYGAIVNGRAICGGYAYATQYLLRLVGIDAVSVTGTGKEELHMWNQVNIDGLWYNLDVTWNDSGDVTRYDYFNVKDEIFSINHTPDPLFIGSSLLDGKTCNLILKDCISDEANYYKKECMIYNGDDASKNQLVTTIANACAERKPYISIVISDELDYEKELNTMFYESPYTFFVAISDANALVGDILTPDEISVAKKEGFCAVTIKLCYVN